jgi:regulatory subunit for Cdc7p protein kinase
MAASLPQAVPRLRLLLRQCFQPAKGQDHGPRSDAWFGMLFCLPPHPATSDHSQREITFFSKDATHVITTRAIPTDNDSSSSLHARGTVNPNQPDIKRSGFEAALQKPSGRSGDVLFKAKELGMKIWSVDKLQRMVDTMFNKETGEEVANVQTRHGLPAAQQKGRQADLQRLLQNEKSDRDYVTATASQDMVPLRGYYVYVHDMDEATRPVMIREYQKVEKDKGKWPQFRASGNGKCPFVEDPTLGRRQQEEQDARRVQRSVAAAAPRTRAASAMEGKIALGENNNLARRPSAPAAMIKVEEEDAKPLDPPKAIPKRTNTDGVPPMFGSAQASIRSMPRFIAGEPVASGLQASNITSAIRSQMISCTASRKQQGGQRTQAKGSGEEHGAIREHQQRTLLGHERRASHAQSGTCSTCASGQTQGPRDTGLHS